jgi:hypothetical protein
MKFSYVKVSPDFLTLQSFSVTLFILGLRLFLSCSKIIIIMIIKRKKDVPSVDDQLYTPLDNSNMHFSPLSPQSDNTLKNTVTWVENHSLQEVVLGYDRVHTGYSEQSIIR